MKQARSRKFDIVLFFMVFALFCMGADNSQVMGNLVILLAVIFYGGIRK